MGIDIVPIRSHPASEAYEEPACLRLLGAHGDRAARAERPTNPGIGKETQRQAMSVFGPKYP
jgi:hypothetical protein